MLRGRLWRLDARDDASAWLRSRLCRVPCVPRHGLRGRPTLAARRLTPRGRIFTKSGGRAAGLTAPPKPRPPQRGSSRSRPCDRGRSRATPARRADTASAIGLRKTLLPSHDDARLGAFVLRGRLQALVRQRVWRLRRPRGYGLRGGSPERGPLVRVLREIVFDEIGRFFGCVDRPTSRFLAADARSTGSTARPCVVSRVDPRHSLRIGDVGALVRLLRVAVAIDVTSAFGTARGGASHGSRNHREAALLRRPRSSQVERRPPRSTSAA